VLLDMSEKVKIETFGYPMGHIFAAVGEDEIL
jgi:hypothetical protein